jgi:hypothetical protein
MPKGTALLPFETTSISPMISHGCQKGAMFYALVSQFNGSMRDVQGAMPSSLSLPQDSISSIATKSQRVKRTDVGPGED